VTGQLCKKAAAFAKMRDDQNLADLDLIQFRRRVLALPHLLGIRHEDSLVHR
jgi:hypothetical protein